MRELLTDLIEDDQKDVNIFQPASKEEQDQREKEKVEINKKEWIEEFIQRRDVRKNPDGTYDVGGTVDLSRGDLDELPVQFGLVEGNFYCEENPLTSLQGAPSKVGGRFYCSKNQLTSLQGAPSKVGGSFACEKNQLTSLQGAPSEVGGSFSCEKNQLTSLQGAPSEVVGNFSCEDNQLTSLQGAPSKVGRGFYCRGNAVQFTEEDVRAVCEVGGEVSV